MKIEQNCSFLWPQSPQRPRLFIGADGMAVASVNVHQAQATLPLLELCAPNHRKSRLDMFRASPSRILMVILAKVDRFDCALEMAGLPVKFGVGIIFESGYKFQ
jgi:hypothetical protein